MITMNELMAMQVQMFKLLQDVMAFLKARLNGQPLAQLWLDNQDVSMALHLSKRTLQTLRDNGTLPYARIQNKIYYKVMDINAMLESNYYRNLTSREKGNKEDC